MTIPELRQLAQWLAGTDIGLLELRTPQAHIRLRRTDGPDGPFFDESVSAEAETGPPPIPAAVAPSVGVFLHHHPLREAALAAPGASVQAGQVVGLVQVGALLLPVLAPQGGVVAAMAAAHGSVVGYGAKLVEFRRA
ncbi:MAG TPA: biotin/lipoyl-containing protein [Burkholderiaceae bacterium]|nr:biotin/lipoyl-containing protein [Burkholderiaceae bacterium]